MAQAPRPLTLTPAAMAYGRPTAIGQARAPRPHVNIDDYLLAEAGNPRAPKRVHPAAPAPKAQFKVELPAPAATEVAMASEPTQSSPDTQSVQLASAEPRKAPELDRYTSRAQSDRDLLQFKGGDAVVITASTLVIVLLIVLLLILLT